MPADNKGAKIEVDTDALEKFGDWLLDRGAELNQPIADIDAIKIAPGNGTYLAEATALTNTVTTRKKQVRDNLTLLRGDLEKLGNNFYKIAKMYKDAEDDNKAEATEFLPLINDTGIAPVTPAPPQPPPPPNQNN